MFRRKYTPVEERMLSEWASKNLEGVPHDVHLRVGCPEGLDPGAPDYEHRRRFFMSLLPEADLVFKEESTTWILEFAIWRPQTKVGQLLVYRELLGDTPGYQDIDPGQIRLKIVIGRHEGHVETVATAAGVDVEVFSPPWLTRALAERTGGRKPTGLRV